MPTTIYRQAVCWYCDGLFNRHEQDHAPIPKSCGGEVTVTACTFCHRLKDMHPAENWPLDLVIRSAAELASHDPQSIGDDGWPTYWDDLSQGARILWAKVERVSLQRSHLLEKTGWSELP